MTKNDSRRQVLPTATVPWAPQSTCALAGREMQLQIDRPLGWPDTADVIPQDAHAAAIAFVAQALENLLSAIGMGIQQPGDARLERIEEAATRRRRMAPV